MCEWVVCGCVVGDKGVMVCYGACCCWDFGNILPRKA